MQPHRTFSALPAVMIIAALAVVMYVSYSFFSKNSPPVVSTKTGSDSSNSVELSDKQLNSIKIEPVGLYRFSIEKKAIGSIAYHEQERDEPPAVLPWLPGSASASDSATKFIIANIPESDSPLIQVGQPVEAKMAAYPDRVWSGRVSVLGVTVYDSGGNPAVDPNTHRIMVRCEIADPKNELYPGMLASISIQVQEPVESVAIPTNGVVRKGDGTMTVWVTADSRHFEERNVKVGLQQDGYDQILDGLKTGELVATDGAIFISSMLYAPPAD